MGSKASHSSIAHRKQCRIKFNGMKIERGTSASDCSAKMKTKIQPKKPNLNGKTPSAFIRAGSAREETHCNSNTMDFEDTTDQEEKLPGSIRRIFLEGEHTAESTEDDFDGR